MGYDGPCIYNNRDKITNQKVTYVVLEGREHSDLMYDYSEERLSYKIEVDEDYDRLEEQYGGEIPSEIRQEWCDTVDRKLLFRLDEELFADIVDFYKQAIEAE